MATTKKPKAKKPEKSKAQETVKNGVTLSITITDDQYALICRTVEEYGYSGVEEWLLEAVSDHM